MAEQRLQHGLIQKANLDAHALGFKILPGPKGFTAWRYTPRGWAWNADFGTMDDAEDYLVGKLCQEER